MRSHQNLTILSCWKKAVKSGFVLLGGLLLFSGWATAELRSLDPARFSPTRFLRTIRRLADEEMMGRGNGTPELNQAAHFIARKFRRFGLQPPPGAGDYLQRFVITVSAAMGPENSLQVETEPGSQSLRRDDDFRPLSFSSNGAVEAPLVFVGYGITAHEHDYDDYNGVEVQGKIVIALHHEPQEHDEEAVFSSQQYTSHSRPVSKAINAKNHGAAGLILVMDAGNHPHRKGSLFRFGTFAGPRSVGIPAVHVKDAVVDRWLQQAGRKETLEGLQKAIDGDLSNHSFAMDEGIRVALRTQVKQNQAEVANVVGYLPGSDPQLKGEYVVIGAHYDHLGLGGPTSLASSKTKAVHHGADDNASGTSGLMELAREFARHRKRLARSMIFVAFAAEELGILGSTYYTAHSPVPLEKTVAMLNLDMIGRIKQGRLYVGGTGSSIRFREMVEEANREIELDLSYSISAYGASDHTSFAVKNIPVLFFFSGLHSDYHKPSDTWDKIDSKAGARILALVYRIGATLNQLQPRPSYVRTSEPIHSVAGGGGGGGYGPYFGSVPDFGQIDNGVRFADIRGGSPADQAGLRAGDILIEFDGKKIENLYDFTYALRAHKPGDKVRVVVQREDGNVSAQVTLGVR